MPRKTPAGGGKVPAGTFASMRPRPDAAENGNKARPASGEYEASMRPRPDAAENGSRD